MSIAKDADLWSVVVTGPRAGLATVCLDEGPRVRILHASAAIGEAAYARTNGVWTLESGFDLKLRDRRRGPPPTEAERQAYLAAMGWVANADSSGTRPREFLIRASEPGVRLSVAFLATSEPALSYWPEALDDDCRSAQVSQGPLPPVAVFRTGRWHMLE